MSGKAQKIKPIQGLRIIFCIFAFTFHASGILSCRENLLGGIFEDGGKLSLTGFLIISGFLDTYLRDSTKENYGIYAEIKYKTVKFFKKYYPVHLLFLALAIPFTLWSVILKQKTLFRFIAELLAGITLTQSLIPVDSFFLSLNDVSWYLSAYLFMIPLTVLAKKIIVKPEKCEKPVSLIGKITITFLILLGLSFLVGKYVTNKELANWIQIDLFIIRAFDYVIGMFIGKLAKIKQYKYISFAVAFSILSLIIIRLLHGEIPIWLTNDVIYVPFVSVIVLGCVSGESIVNKFLSLKPMVYLGDNSFNYYISHYVILKYLFLALSHFNLTNFYSSNLFCVAVLIVSFIAVIVMGEILNLIRRLRKKKANHVVCNNSKNRGRK